MELSFLVKKFIISNDNFLMCYILMGNLVIDFIVEIFFQWFDCLLVEK